MSPALLGFSVTLGQMLRQNEDPNCAAAVGGAMLRC